MGENYNIGLASAELCLVVPHLLIGGEFSVAVAKDVFLIRSTSRLYDYVAENS